MTPTILIMINETLRLYVIYDNQISPFVCEMKFYEKLLKKDYNKIDIFDFRDIFVSAFSETFRSFNYCLMKNNEIVDYIVNDLDENVEHEQREGLLQ